MNTLRFASVDIGSNSVRLLFCNVTDSDAGVSFKKAELIRIPIRLGDDVFLKGRISKDKVDRLIMAMKAFNQLRKVFGAIDYMACATSAMREAANREEVVARVKKETGIHIEVIDGKKEAQLIYSNREDELLDPKNAYLFIDIGGGSTELTLWSKGKTIASKSFNIGTIRLMYDKVERSTWAGFKTWIRENTILDTPIIGVGSGGNINKLYKLADRKHDQPLTYKKLKSMSEALESMSMEERIHGMGLNPDRADVIVPASKIMLTVMKNASIKDLIVPQVGLSDGIIHALFNKRRK